MSFENVEKLIVGTISSLALLIWNGGKDFEADSTSQPAPAVDTERW